MRDFLLVFRTDYGTMSAMAQRTAEQIQAMTNKWMEWIGSVAAQNKLADRGNRLHNTGKVVKANNVVTDGPYAEIKESIGGYTMIKADSYEEAVEIAKGCPILTVGGNVEVREVSHL